MAFERNREFGDRATGPWAGWWLVAGLAAAACFTAAGPAAQDLTYTILDLGNQGASSICAEGINDAGQVTGYYFADDETRGFLYDGSQMVEIGTLGGTYCRTYGLNNHAHVTGGSSPVDTPNPPIHAFIYDGVSMTDLDPSGGYSYGVAVNDTDQVAGWWYNHAARWSEGVREDLGNLGGDDCYALGINNPGQVVGYSYLGDGTTDAHAFLWESGVGMTDLGTLGGGRSFAYDINDLSQVTGYSLLPPGHPEYGNHAFLWHDGIMIDLGTLGGQNSFGDAINNVGQVVGEAEGATGPTCPFLWQDGVMVNLNDLLPPESGWQLWTAGDINNLGEITGVGMINGESHVYILSPARIFADGFESGNNSAWTIAVP
ncbi:MAG: hypothetical protein K8R59_10455 [Thermoanaerobaculales bacterium]|nr:hypothetical protein [Thermoanaerobaculales bacterium]